MTRSQIFLQGYLTKQAGALDAMTDKGTPDWALSKGTTPAASPAKSEGKTYKQPLRHASTPETYDRRSPRNVTTVYEPSGIRETAERIPQQLKSPPSPPSMAQRYRNMLSTYFQNAAHRAETVPLLNPLADPMNRGWTSAKDTAETKRVIDNQYGRPAGAVSKPQELPEQ